jgi:starch-binding outer membrane protein SusE/F
MKNIYKIFIAVIMVTGLWSCESEDNFMLVEAPAASFSIITPGSGTQIVLTEEMPQNNTALTLTWEEVSYGTPTVVNYTVQFAVNGTEFAEPKDISSSSATNHSITVEQLNAIALDLGLMPEVESGIDVRIRSTVGTTGSEEKFSDVITLLITPYPSNVIRQLYLVGDGTAGGWNTANDNIPMFRDPEDLGKFYYTGRFTAGSVKLIEVYGQWAPMFGFDGAGGLIARPTEADPDPASLAVPSEGYYTLTVDLTAMTYTFEPLATVPATHATIGFIGSSRTGDDTGWNSDDDMTAYTFDPHIWKINITLFDGMGKFRTNNDWAVNWGANTPISGMGTPGGPDIPVTAGEYNIYFNDIDGRYIFIPVE